MNEKRFSRVLTGAILALFFIAVLLICANVMPCGDDLFYGIFTKEGLARYIERHIEHYQLANGRVIVHLLATFFLGQPLWLWRVVNALCFTLCAWWIVRLATEHERARPVAAALTCAAFLMIDPQITRQSVYWLTGSCNYLYPMLMLLGYWLALRRGLRRGTRMLWLPVLAFFAAATTEQGGLMCFGVTLLLLLDEKFLKKRRIRPAHVIALIACALGIATVLLAPGLANRAGMTDAPVEGGTLSLMLYNLLHQGKNLFLTGYMRIYHISMLFFATFLLGKYTFSQKPQRLFYALGMLLGALSLVCYLCIPADLGHASLSFAAVTIGGYLLTLLWCGVGVLRERRSTLPLIALILAFGSQLAMIVSPVAGPRTMTSFLFMAALFLACIGAEVMDLGALGAFGTLFCARLGQPYFAALALPAGYFSVFGARCKRAFAALAIVPILLSSLLIWKDTYVHTAQNAAVYRENLAALKEYSGTGELVQRKLPAEDYIWVMPYHNSYYDPYYNIFYDLPGSTKITWVS